MDFTFLLYFYGAIILGIPGVVFLITSLVLMGRAIFTGDTAIVNYLLEKGADVSTKGYSYPVEIAIRSYKPNSLEVIKSLVKYGADINTNNGTPLSEAMSPYNHDYDIAYYLLEQGAKVDNLPAFKSEVKYNMQYNLHGSDEERHEDSLQLVKILKLLNDYSTKDSNLVSTPYNNLH